jgi:hypothetical protein
MPAVRSPTLETAMMWHRRLEPAHRWLRETTLRIADAVAVRAAE